MNAPAQDIRALTGLRGLAAVAVVIGHAEANAGATPFFRGQPAVDLFFALSGFVISYVYLRSERIDWRSFAVARFARIYPLHLATAMFMAVAGIGFAIVKHAPFPAHVNALQALREITLTMAMPGVGALKLWNFPAWSISVEWWTYFTAFPLIAVLHRRATVGPACLAFLGIALALVLALYFIPDGAKTTRGWIAFARAVIGFAGGWVAYLALRANVAPQAWVATLLLVVTVVVTFVAPIATGHDAWFLLPIYPVLIWALAAGPSSAASRLCSGRLVVWLGEISFSIYLIHPLSMNFLEAVDALIMPVEGRWAWVMLTLTLTLIGGTLSYYWFEAPVRDRLRQWAGATRRSAAPADPRPQV